MATVSTELSYQVMNELDRSNGDIIYDPTSINWLSYDWSQGYLVHTISYNDLLKPYLISYSYYGTVEYEDVIMWLNNVQDPWELILGTQLWIPYLANLKTFMFKNIKY